VANQTFREVASLVPPDSALAEVLSFDHPTHKRGKPKHPYSAGQLSLSVQDAAWLAAIVDGEGSVCFKQILRRFPI
jgi:hypothetical protein